MSELINRNGERAIFTIEEVLINNDMFQLVTDKERDVDQIISLGMMGGFNPFDYEVFF